MRTLSNSAAPVTLAAALFLQRGCGRAPMINLDGSFMPSWMICLAGGLIVAGLLQWQLLHRKMQHRVMPTVIFYPCVVVAVACLLWLLLF